MNTTNAAVRGERGVRLLSDKQRVSDPSHYNRPMSKDLIVGGIIAWRDPPPLTKPAGSGARTHNWQLMAFQLRSNPGEWGLLTMGPRAHMFQSRISSGRTSWWAPAGSFATRVHTRPDGVKELYAKYVGPPEQVAT